MNLNELLKSINQKPLSRTINVTDVQLDSRQIKSGALFCALGSPQTARTQGHAFITEAIQQGAVAVLQEGEQEQVEWQRDIPVITIQELSKKVGFLASYFFNHPTRQLTVVGITGTNGKTSCSYFLAQALTRLDKRCGMIGTLGYGEIESLQSTGMTTPDAITLQRLCAEFVEQGVEVVVMEVSSHALAQYRADGVAFDLAVLTNLTQDHLDYHGNMQNYAAAKRRLLTWPGLTDYVVNYDDEEGQEWLRILQADPTRQACSYSINQANTKAATIAVESVSTEKTGMILPLSGKGKPQTLRLDLLGDFNAGNALAVFCALYQLGFSGESIALAMQKIKSAPGRMQLLQQAGCPVVVVDYAHTPDALEKVLITLRKLTRHCLICVFGCGGDRDRGKRPLMGAVAARYADRIYITNDNPRTEPPEQIVENILSGMIPPPCDQLPSSQSAEPMSSRGLTAGSIIPSRKGTMDDVGSLPRDDKIIIKFDRAQAIREAIESSDQEDIVLLAGKGHETTQTIGDEVIPFDDAEQVKLIFKVQQAE